MPGTVVVRLKHVAARCAIMSCEVDYLCSDVETIQESAGLTLHAQGTTMDWIDLSYPTYWMINVKVIHAHSMDYL